MADSDQSIDQLNPVISLDGSENVPLTQHGVTMRATVMQIASATGDFLNAPVISSFLSTDYVPIVRSGSVFLAPIIFFNTTPTPPSYLGQFSFNNPRNSVIFAGAF